MHGVELTQSIEFEMSLLLFVALAGYLLAARIAQPAVDRTGQLRFTAHHEPGNHADRSPVIAKLAVQGRKNV